MVLLDDVGAELGHGRRRPVDVVEPVFQRLLECGRDDRQVEPSRGTGGIERGLPAAAVVDPETLEDACPAGPLEDEIRDGTIGRYRAHAGSPLAPWSDAWSMGSAATQSRLRSPRMQTSPT